MPAERAAISDIDALVGLRLAFLREDNGRLDDREAETLRERLPEYFRAHLNRDLFVFVVREEAHIVSCAFLLVVEKPMSPAFLNGKTGIVLNVYTLPSCRRRGYARQLMEALIREAKNKSLSSLELKSTEHGYDLYRSVGFSDDRSKYHPMKWKNPELN